MFRVRRKRTLPLETEFATLLEGLRRNHDAYFDHGFKIVAALSVTLGWFAVQSNPLQQMCAADHLLKAAVAVLFLSFVAVTVVFLLHYQKSEMCKKAMTGLGIPAPAYSSDLISLPALLAGIAFQLIMFFCVGMSIWLVYPDGKNSEICIRQRNEAPAKPAIVKEKPAQAIERRDREAKP